MITTIEKIEIIDFLLERIDEKIKLYHERVNEYGIISYMEANKGLCHLLPEIEDGMEIEIINQFQEDFFERAESEGIIENQFNANGHYFWYDQKIATTDPEKWYQPRIDFLNTWKEELEEEE